MKTYINNKVMYILSPLTNVDRFGGQTFKNFSELHKALGYKGQDNPGYRENYRNGNAHFCNNQNEKYKVIQKTIRSSEYPVYQFIRDDNGNYTQQLACGDENHPLQISEQDNILYLHCIPEANVLYVGITECSVEERWGRYGEGYGSQQFRLHCSDYGWRNVIHYAIPVSGTRAELENLEELAIAVAIQYAQKYGYTLDNKNKTTGNRYLDKNGQMTGLRDITYGTTNMLETLMELCFLNEGVELQ